VLAIDVVRSELIQLSGSINNLICSQDGQPGNSFLGWKFYR